MGEGGPPVSHAQAIVLLVEVGIVALGSLLAILRK
jgi:hypothetical protein